MDDLEALVAASDVFAGRLAGLSRSELEGPSSCPGWTVFDLVNHVNGGGRRYLLLLQGASAEDVDGTRAQDHVGSDAVASFRRWQNPLNREFAADGALLRTVHHPLGQRTGADLLGMRLLDLVLHGWDLARSRGLDERLDSELVAHLLDHHMHLVDQLRVAGVYGQEGVAWNDPQSELLSRSGRLGA